MINSREDLKEYIAEDNNWLIPVGIKGRLAAHAAGYPTIKLKRFMRYLRKQEYYINTANGNIFKGCMGLFYEGRKNRLGLKLGIEIGPNCFGKGLNIYHIGSIIVNPSVRAGDNCSLHGANCIGNNGITKQVPILGDNVDVGYGAVIIGEVKIADNIKIGANAVVNKSFSESDVTIAGIPAKIVNRQKL